MKLRVPQATKQGYIEVGVGGIFDFSYPTSKLRRGRVQGGGKICPTLMAGESMVLVFEQIYDVTQVQESGVDGGKKPHPG